MIDSVILIRTFIAALSKVIVIWGKIVLCLHGLSQLSLGKRV